MELLKEWLGSTITHELKEALQWRMSRPTNMQLSGHNRYEDDGSNLRVKGLKPGIVQITKLVTIKDPVEVWVSDSTFRLRATIAASAVQNFYRSSKKRINQSTLGGLLQIVDFEIVATHLGPRESRLTLLVNDFKSLGSEGSGSFGNPRPIQVNREILELLENVNEFRRKESDESGQRTRKHAADEESFQSENDDLSSDDGQLSDQQALATQVPHRQLQKKTTLKKSDNAAALLTLLPQNNSFRLVVQPELDKRKTAPAQDPAPETRAKKLQAAVVEPSELKDQRTENQILTQKLVTLVTESEGSPRANPGAVPQNKRDSEIARDSAELISNKSPDMALSQISHRISGKDVKIPRDQEFLLDQKDSWIPAEPGQRTPAANVPIKILQIFNRLAENHTTPSPKRTRTTSDQGTPVSWSPSPDREQLPPDSSPEGSVEGQVKLVGSFQSEKKKSMNTSVSPSSSVSVHGNILGSSPCPVSTVRGGGLRPSDKCSTSSNETHVKPANVSDAKIIRKINDSSNLELQPQLVPVPSNDQCSSKSSQHEQKSEEIFATKTVEEHNDNASGSQRGTPFSPDYSQLKSISPTNHISISILSGTSNTIDLSTEGQSILVSDTESLAQEENPQSPCLQVLNQKRDSKINGSVQQFFSTASQPEEPILQVKRTPYVNGHILNRGSEILVSHASPSKKPLPIGHTTSQDPVIIDTSSAETQSTTQNEDFNDPDAIDEESIALQVQHEIDSQYPKNLSMSPLQDIAVDTVEETLLLGTAASETSIKRTSSDAQLFRPDVAKRRQTSKPPDPLELIQVQPDMPDPSIFGRRFRQEFLASRKDSKSRSETMRHVSQERSISSASSHNKEKIKMVGQIGQSAVFEKEHEDSAMDLDNPALSVSVRPLTSQKADSSISIASEGSQKPRTGQQKTVDESLDVVMLDTDIKNSQEQQQANAIGAVPVDRVQSPAGINIFDRFKSTYPDFVGNMKQFIAICGKIRDLVKAGRGEHQALWDDFIVRHNTEYPRYLSRCTNEVEDPVPYDQFYRDQIEEPRYVKQIITRKTIDDVLVLRSQISINLNTGQQPRSISGSTSVPAALEKKKPNRSSNNNSTNVPQQTTPRATIDLSAESDEFSQRDILPRSGKKSSRILPWIASDTPSSILQLNQDTPVVPRVLPRTSRSYSHSRSNHASQMKAVDFSFAQFHHSKTTAPEQSVHSLKPLSATLSTKSLRESSPTPVDLAATVPPSTTNHPKARTTVDEISKHSNLKGNGLDAPDEWWKDKNSPFTSFARAYNAIQPGKGNSYARPEPKVEYGEVRLDFLNWHI